MLKLVRRDCEKKRVGVVGSVRYKASKWETVGEDLFEDGGIN